MTKVDSETLTIEWRQFLETETGKRFMKTLDQMVSSRNKRAEALDPTISYGNTQQRVGIEAVIDHIELHKLGEEGRKKRFKQDG